MKRKDFAFMPILDFDIVSSKRSKSPVSKFTMGFTLIELLVVIAIIGMLSAVVLSATASARSKSRDARRQQDIHQIQLALALYYQANGRYPAVGGATSPGSVWANSADASWTALQVALQPYIPSLSVDPLENYNAAQWATGGYHYSYIGNYGQQGCAAGQFYWLVYHLENAAGPDPGVVMCDGTLGSQYGGTGANTYVKTIGFSTK